MNAAQLINQDSGIVEYYTPVEIVDAAREVMGDIDLDPFSSAAANEVVQAGSYYDEAANGFEQTWWGNVWANHPFSRKNNLLFSAKWCASRYDCRAICNITYAATSESWFQPFMQCLQCFISPRVNYRLQDGTTLKGVSKGSVVTYWGPEHNRFRKVFAKFGTVK